MSLFPAFTDTPSSSSEPQDSSKAPELNWLQNSSFQTGTVESIPQPSAVSEENVPEKAAEIAKRPLTPSSSDRKQSRWKKVKKSKLKEPPPIVDVPRIQSSDGFELDLHMERSFLTVPTLSRPAVPKYKQSGYSIGKPRRKRNFKQKRYYHRSFLVAEDEPPNAQSTESKDGKPSEFSNRKTEEEITKMTGELNKQLGEDPFDVETWLKYSRFQDVVWQFEKNYKRGSSAKGARVTAERKLAILDKGLAHNPECEPLLRERLAVAVSVYPADELSVQLKVLVEKEPSNIIFWQGFIEATQCSMAHCNTPAVVGLYNKCLMKLHQLRRSSVMEKSILEERILCMLYQCGLFMKQAGLFEQLWTLLRLYLELNLSPLDKRKFNIASGFDEKCLVELEEVILNSQLPIHELWLRVEKLRESCHWLPWSQADKCEDPQRMVFVEDVSDLIHPITTPGNAFKLTLTILTMLKMPLLPCRHTTIEELGLDYVPWALDSIEPLLSSVYPNLPFDLTNQYLLKNMSKLAVGPQYIKTLPGQEEYLDFLCATIRNCGECLRGDEQTAVFLLWFRLERLLLVLEKLDMFKMPADRKKRVKKLMKDFLKKEAFRNNVLFYREYALLEMESGEAATALKILLTALSMKMSGSAVISFLNKQDRADLCSLYRTLVELHLHGPLCDKQKATNYLVALIFGQPLDKVKIANSIQIEEALVKFQHITTELFEEKLDPPMACDHYLPDFFTDWIACNAWLLYIVKSPIEAGTFLEDVIARFGKDDVTWRKEVLVEFYAGMLFKNSIENAGEGLFGLMEDALHRGLEKFPNNLTMLAMAAKDQNLGSCSGKPWWKWNSLLSKTGHAIPILFLVLILNQHLTRSEEEWENFSADEPIQTTTSLVNKLRGLFKRLTGPEMCTRRCGLMWRLYLQFLYKFSDPETCRNTYYSAVEECPWLKALYIDAAIYIPEELPQIQDLIIEKQLRLHITPEELDILRN